MKKPTKIKQLEESQEMLEAMEIELETEFVVA